MTIPAAPLRTPAGEDELRHRTRKLGQRYRTVLLLVDGRRPLDELLGLAQQAGAAVSHFEELVQLGLVEITADAVLEPQTATDAAEATSTSGADVEATALVRASDDDEGDILRAAATEVALPASTDDALRGTTTAPLAPSNERPAAVAQETPEERLLQQVRDLLIDTLGIDSPLFGARTFFRVRGAQSTSDLIDLVWEIENHLTNKRHSRDELISLQRARELLGMGNTRVAGDTQSGVLPE